MTPQLEIAIRRLSVEAASLSNDQDYKDRRFASVGEVCMQVVPILDGTVNCHCWISGGSHHLGVTVRKHTGVRRTLRWMVGRIVYQLPLRAVANLE